MADEGKTNVSDEEIAAAVGEELPDRAAMSTITSGCGPEEFGVAAGSVSDATIPPDGDPQPGPLPMEPLPEEEL
jgi:hypothetical protein